MSQFRVDRSAPAYAGAQTLIEAPIEMVWRLLADLEGWPGWNASVSKIRVEGSLRPGCTFAWTAGGSRIVSRIEAIDPPRRIAWTGRTLGIRAAHVWELERSDGQTRVTTEECFDGLVVKLFRGRMRKLLAAALEQGLGALKAEAERLHAKGGDSCAGAGSSSRP